VRAGRVTAGVAGGSAVFGLAVPAAVFLLAIAGLGISSYLAYAHWANATIACTGLEGCNEVNTSEYSKMAGIPVALLGIIFYLALGATALAWLWWRPQSLAWPIIAAWGLALGGIVFSVYLTYLELFVIEAVCIYCVSSAAIVLACFLILTVAVIRESQASEA
jgi:uncharacterized membrane protein